MGPATSPWPLYLPAWWSLGFWRSTEEPASGCVAEGRAGWPAMDSSRRIFSPARCPLNGRSQVAAIRVGVTASGRGLRRTEAGCPTVRHATRTAAPVPRVDARRPCDREPFCRQRCQASMRPLPLFPARMPGVDATFTSFSGNDAGREPQRYAFFRQRCEARRAALRLFPATLRGARRSVTPFSGDDAGREA